MSDCSITVSVEITQKYLFDLLIKNKSWLNFSKVSISCELPNFSMTWINKWTFLSVSKDFCSIKYGIILFVAEIYALQAPNFSALLNTSIINTISKYWTHNYEIVSLFFDFEYLSLNLSFISLRILNSSTSEKECIDLWMSLK